MEKDLEKPTKKAYVSIALFPENGIVKGFQSGLVAITNKIYGMQNGVIVGAENVYGMQTGFYVVVECDLKGMQNSLIFAGAKDVYGIQNSLFAGADNVYGIQNSFYGVVRGNLKGMQNSLFAFTEGDLKGMQNSFYGVVRGDLKGIQIGLHVFAKGRNSTGKQFGFLLWGPGNEWWNPSVFYQKLEPGKKVKPFGTLETIMKKVWSG